MICELNFVSNKVATDCVLSYWLHPVVSMKQPGDKKKKKTSSELLESPEHLYFPENCHTTVRVFLKCHMHFIHAVCLITTILTQTICDELCQPGRRIEQ